MGGSAPNPENWAKRLITSEETSLHRYDKGRKRKEENYRYYKLEARMMVPPNSK